MTDLNLSGNLLLESELPWEYCDRILECRCVEDKDLFNLKGHSVRTITYIYYGLECYSLHKNKTKRQSNTYQIPLKLRIWVNWDINKTICGFEYITLNWGTCQTKIATSHQKFNRTYIILQSSKPILILLISSSHNTSPSQFHYPLFWMLREKWTLCA